MNPRPFEYHSPKTLGEALELAGKLGSEAKFLAGGQTLLPLMKLRIASPGHIIDLGRIPELAYIRTEGGGLAIGALTRMSEIATSKAVLEESPILSQCANQTADPLVRNMGTIGGNLSHGDPSADMPAVVVATGASLETASLHGKRTIPGSQFFLDTFTTALAEGEILVEARFPVPPRRVGAYLKLERQAGDFGIVGVAAVLDFDPGGKCTGCGIGLSGVGPTVIKATKAEQCIVGSAVDKESVELAAAAAAGEARPIADLRGSADYKRQMVSVMTRRALQQALDSRVGR
ncbi:MAG: xanthine dehydrogenase family protein subunit M [Nitrososphaerales archaeon]|nr:xanthine dehydrogenase family protein subunit M [Nitrososphaerales archaeon]